MEGSFVVSLRTERKSLRRGAKRRLCRCERRANSERAEGVRVGNPSNPSTSPQSYTTIFVICICIAFTCIGIGKVWVDCYKDKR